MKILFITYHFLDETGGGSFASRAYVNAFSEIADSCMLLYPDRGKPIIGFIHNKCIPVGIWDKRNNVTKAINLFTGKINRYMNVINSKVNVFNPDIVVFDNSHCSAGMIKNVKKFNKKIITIHHNYMPEYYHGTKPYVGLKSLFLNSIFLRYMKKAERTAVLYSDLNLTLTDQDIHLLYNHYDPKKTVQIVKIGCFEPETVSRLNDNQDHHNKFDNNNKFCFVITGSLCAYQSEFSIASFFEDLYSDLLKRLPESNLIIAGKNPSMKMRNICNKFPSVSLISNPENMQEIIALADIYICPTCVGGGLKLRVMDGLKAGLPVLTHTVSARGYEEFKNANCMFIYENKSTFIESLEKVIALIHNSKVRKKTVMNTYESLFSFESGVARLRKILSTL